MTKNNDTTLLALLFVLSCSILFYFIVQYANKYSNRSTCHTVRKVLVCGTVVCRVELDNGKRASTSVDVVLEGDRLLVSPSRSKLC